MEGNDRRTGRNLPGRWARWGRLLGVGGLVLAFAQGGCLTETGADDGDSGIDPGGHPDAILDAADPAPDTPDLPIQDVPTDVPPTDVPPTDVPPTDLPPDGDVWIDQTCWETAPSFPDRCDQVSSFQCGFGAECVDGVIHAAWHVHHFCSETDPIEDIIDYDCTFPCAHGCLPGDIEGWPETGPELVALYCAQCAAPADCEGRTHDACEGAWSCDGGTCTWTCGAVPCVAEGGSVAVIPDAPECCDGLVKVSCDAPDADGACQGCDGASVCTACGDDACGLGENPCNCPDDCLDVQKSPLPGSQSECQGSAARDADVGPEGTVTLQVVDGKVVLLHEALLQNCCLVLQVWGIVDEATRTLRFEERPVDPSSLCFCECRFTLTAEWAGLPAGTWAVTVYNEFLDRVVATGEVTIP